MGIRMTDVERGMVRQAALFKRDGLLISGYLLGYLACRVDHFLTGVIDRKQLADDAAMVELTRTLYHRCTAQQLDQIAFGTRELPGEDVHSGE